MNVLEINENTKPSDALELPEGGLVLGAFEVDVTPDNVVACATLVQKHCDTSGESQEFYSQAGIVAFAGNELGWGQGKGYRTL